jgi:ATP-binding cassette subfamily A (ABC1) protein 3
MGAAAVWAASGRACGQYHLITYFHNTSFDGVRLEAFGSHHGQVKFSVPAMSGSGEDEKYATEDDLVEVIGRDKTVTTPQQKKGGVQALFSLLEENKDAMGLKFYSVGTTTLDQVFLTRRYR